MNNKLEKSIEISAWIVAALLLAKFVPRKRIREAHVAFLFKQVITWFFGLLVVEKNLISYPYRLFFKKAIKSSFTFEYFVFPTLNVLFNIYYPEKRNLFLKASYYASHTLLVTFLEWIALKYTKLIRYENWTLYNTFISIWLSYYVSRQYQRWFFKNKFTFTRWLKFLH